MEDINTLTQKANSGDAVAMRKLGYEYLIGKNIQKDEKKAFQLFRAAVWEGDLNATIYCGYCCKTGAVCTTRASGGHAGAHVLVVFQPVINDFSRRSARDFHSAPRFSKHTRAASRHRPACGRRALVSVGERKTELLLRRSKVARCHRQHPVTVSSRDCHRAKRKRLSHRRAGTEQAVERAVQIHQAER